MEEEKTFKGSEISCNFKTNLAEKFKVDEDQKIVIQTNFTDKSLQELLKARLEEENPDFIVEEQEELRFEFIIYGQFLRGNIKSHLQKLNKTNEEDITILYTFGINKPREDKKVKEEDWISHLSLLNPYLTNKESPFIASLFNGDIAFYDSNVDLLYRTNITDVPVKKSLAAQQIGQAGSKQNVIISACQDELVRVGVFHQPAKGSENKSYSYTSVAECIGNESSVTSIDVNPLNSNQFCAGTYLGKLNIFNVSESVIEKAENSFQTLKNGKKVKLEKKVIEPLQTNDIHSETITNSLWKNQHSIYTSSLDHNIKLYDTQKVQVQSSIGTKDSAVTAFDFREDIVFSGHEDSYIKTYDFRQGNKGPTNIFKSHTLWISDIKILPQNEYMFLSSSYDHSIKLWDMRSQFPIFSLKSHHDKIFSIAWNGDSKIISGGSDQQIASHVFTLNKE